MRSFDLSSKDRLKTDWLVDLGMKQGMQRPIHFSPSLYLFPPSFGHVISHTVQSPQKQSFLSLSLWVGSEHSVQRTAKLFIDFGSQGGKPKPSGWLADAGSQEASILGALWQG
jgi:hypothetical protein